jgi:hypothetical protein
MRLRGGELPPSAPQAALANATSFSRRAPEQRRDALARRAFAGTSLLRHLAAARVHLDQDPGHRFRVSTIDATHVSTRLPRLHFSNQLIIEFQLALFSAIPRFRTLFRQRRLPIPHDGEERRRTHRHSERTGCPPQSRPIPESPPAPGTISTSTAMTDPSASGRTARVRRFAIGARARPLEGRTPSPADAAPVRSSSRNSATKASFGPFSFDTSATRPSGVTVSLVFGELAADERRRITESVRARVRSQRHG